MLDKTKENSAINMMGINPSLPNKLEFNSKLKITLILIIHKLVHQFMSTLLVNTKRLANSQSLLE